jgi:hypothetical protein
MFKDMFYQINPKMVHPGIDTIVLISVSTDNTAIWYDHWEDGLEAQITNATQATTKILGDGKASNGCAPDVVNCTDAVDK